MGGGLMQLVAYGAQDVYLTGNPQITFFKVIYRRHTNFALESIEQTFNGLGDWSKKVTCTISRNGDLIHRAYLRVELPDVQIPNVEANDPNPNMFRWLNWVGHILIKSVELEIGGQRIDKHYGDWIHIWNELTQTAGHQLGYATMVGNTPYLTNVSYGNSGSVDPVVVKGDILYIPLEFFWNRNPGLALPLIALQYHEVKINVELNDAKNCFWAGYRNTDGTLLADQQIINMPSLRSCSLFVDYVYLDTDERRRFAQVSHEYLIEQLQFTGDESTSNTNNKFKLNFNHPTKELIWVVQPDDNVDVDKAPFGKQWFNYTDAFDTTYETVGNLDQTGAYAASNATILTGNGDLMAGAMPGIARGGANNVYIPVSFENGKNPVQTALLQLNGHDRFSIRDGKYFNLVQPYQHHENVPSCGINVYSFALRPEEHQPSGTCNFSRIDNATLQLTLTRETVENNRSAKVRIYAVNYNVLRVMSGMGGLAYSN